MNISSIIKFSACDTRLPSQISAEFNGVSKVLSGQISWIFGDLFNLFVFIYFVIFVYFCIF